MNGHNLNVLNFTYFSSGVGKYDSDQNLGLLCMKLPMLMPDINISIEIKLRKSCSRRHSRYS